VIDYLNPALYDVIVSDVNSPFEEQRRKRIKDILSHNAHLAALCEKDCFERDNKLFQKIIRKAEQEINNQQPLQATLAFLEYKEFSRLATVLKLEKKYQTIFKREAQLNERIYNILIHHSAFSFEHSLALFKELQKHSPLNIAIESSRKNYLITYSSLINKGNYEQGILLIKEMQSQGLQPDVTTYNTLINKANYEQGILLLKEMQSQGLQPDVITYNTLLRKAQRMPLNETLKLLTLMQKAGLKPQSGFNKKQKRYRYYTLEAVSPSVRKDKPLFKEWATTQGLQTKVWTEFYAQLLKN